MRLLLFFIPMVFVSLAGASVVAVAQENATTAEQPAAPTVNERFALAEAYRTGEGAELDLAQAVSIYEELAAGGHARSWFRLGKLYLEMDRNEDAMLAFEESDRNGYSRAAAELAIGHARSRFGSFSDPSRGVSRLADLAAAQGDERVLFELAEAYYSGRGTDRDLEQAFEIYTRLAGVANERALYRLGEFYRRGLLQPRPSSPRPL